MNNKSLAVGLLALCLSGNVLADTNDDFEVTERWIADLSEKLLQKGEVSGTYLNNYLQCLQDQQALAEEPGSTLTQLWQQLVGASNSCAPVIEDMVDALKAEDQQAETLRQQLEDLQRSL